MNVKRFFVIFLLVILALTTYVQAETPEITATAGTVIDCIDGKFLYDKNMNEKLYPASLTKILTAILVVENCEMTDEVVVSQNAIDNVQYGYLTANIKVGEILTVEQLLNLLLISSYNDVSNILEEHVGGDKEGFAIMMNKKAKEIGCTNSNFVNSNGAHDVNHYSTVHDMALIGKYAMQYDEIKEIVSKTSYELGSTNQYTGDSRIYTTTNEMLLSWSVNYYKYAKGVKTGFTTPAGYCLMTYTEKNEMPLISVVMKSTTSDSRYSDSKKIIEYAYENNTIRTIADAGTTVQTLTIKKGTKDTKKLNAVLQNSIIAVVKNENKKASVEPKVEIYDKLKASIAKGQIIGKVTYEIEGKAYTENLIAENEVKKSKTGITFLWIFIGLVSLFGTLRARTLYKRNKILKKIRGKQK